MEGKGVKSKRCKNCNHIASGIYCSNCGEKLKPGRIDFHHMMHGISHGLIHFDSGFIFTAKEMAVRPGYSIRDYIHGKRKLHGNPLFMLIIVGALLSYLYSHYEINTPSSVDLHHLEESSHFLTSKFFALVYFCFCIFFAIVDYLIFKYRRYNVMELFYLNVFIGVQALLFNFFMALLLYILKDPITLALTRITYYILVIFYASYVKYQFFNLKYDRKGRLRLILDTIVFAGCLYFYGHRAFEIMFQNIR